jgi:hypothetical protein
MWKWLTVLAAVATLAGSQSGVKPTKDETGVEPEAILWIDPGDPSLRDFENGIGGSESRPEPPFQFVDEDRSGTSSKINVTDGRGRSWNVKWGREVSASVFCTRLVWACGYFTEPEYFIASGRIEGVKGLKRAGSHISHDGSFKRARFQLRSDTPKFVEGRSWTWAENPFVGTRQFQGLKILMLLLSNWDGKDARDFVDGGSRMDSNLGIFLDELTGKPRYFYADDDWGASLGKWGGTLTWTKWDCKGFADQTSDFVKQKKNGELKWGYDGKHEKDLTSDISVADVQWLLQYLGRITDEQIRRGLESSGASPKDTQCYVEALSERIEKLKRIAVPISSR